MTTLGKLELLLLEFTKIEVERSRESSKEHFDSSRDSFREILTYLKGGGRQSINSYTLDR